MGIVRAALERRASPRQPNSTLVLILESGRGKLYRVYVVMFWLLPCLRTSDAPVDLITDGLHAIQCNFPELIHGAVISVSPVVANTDQNVHEKPNFQKLMY